MCITRANLISGAMIESCRNLQPLPEDQELVYNLREDAIVEDGRCSREIEMVKCEMYLNDNQG